MPRPRLVERLARRWDHPVTLVVAGPGFGKTTALAQAVRAHLLCPRGVDAWVSCTAAHGDAAALTASVLAALPGCARSVLDAVVRLAPAEVCLILDDVHEIPACSPGAALLADLVRALPATTHLVLAGRTVPDLPLARHEAAGDVLAIGADELSFTDMEVCALGRRLGREPAAARPLRGWPALVRLAFAAGPGAPWRYAREEILGRVPAGWRRALTALAALGAATEDEVASVTGEPVDLAELCTRIPLVTVLDDGRYRAHDLWTEALSRMLTDEETQSLHRAAAAALTARGELARAGSLAIRTRDWALLADLAVELVLTTLSALPAAVARHWLAAVPPIVADEPAFLLLRAAVLHAADYADPRVDPLLDRAVLPGRGGTAVLAQAVITAHSRADLTRLAELAERARVLPSDAVVRCLRHSLDATLADMAGDPTAALAEITQAPVAEVPRALALSTVRFHYHCLDMCGFCGEAAELADRMTADTDDDHVRLAAAIARWFDGDPADLPRLRTALTRLTPDAGTARDKFVTAAFLAVITACAGGRPAPLACGDHDNPRDGVLACAASAAAAVADGDEAAARQAYADHLSRWPLESRFNERHLRRFLALGYVLDDRLRQWWDSVPLGPAHERARDAGRALTMARTGVLVFAARLPAEHALCYLPLPWSVELAVRLAAVDEQAGAALGRLLGDTAGPAAHRWLRQYLQSDELAAGAARLLALLPTPPTQCTGIEVLGALRVTRAGVPVDAPELRRSRVRQLLCALVLRPDLPREQAVELLWPDHRPAAAARNLRVTLTHLRRLLEPDRTAGDASYHLRTDGDTLRLVPSAWLTVDLWHFTALGDEATTAMTTGDVDQAATHLTDAAALWRGEPLPDLRDTQETSIEIDRIRARYVENLLQLGELRMLAGEPAESTRLAVQALAVEPYDARGHRLALAAALKDRDPTRIATARTAVLTALRQLGVAPDPATGLLLGMSG